MHLLSHPSSSILDIQEQLLGEDIMGTTISTNLRSQQQDSPMASLLVVRLRVVIMLLRMGFSIPRSIISHSFPNRLNQEQIQEYLSSRKTH
jgi:hypothetical protein